MIRCKELGKSFATKQEMFTALKNSKGEIMEMKKAAIKYSDPCGLSIVGDMTKALQPSGTISYGDYVYPVINTTKILDNHGDVHLDGIWNKSAPEQSGKTFLIVNHDLSVGKVVSMPKDVEIMIKEMHWSELGESYEGKTQALIFKSKLTERSNRDAFLSYKENDPVQHSIRMQYVKIDMAIDSDSEDFKEEKAVWDEVYPQIVNKEDAVEQGYFWAVREAKIYKEGSMVLAGSNHATPTLYDLEAGRKSTSNNEPSKDTHFNVSEAIQTIKFNL